MGVQVAATCTRWSQLSPTNSLNSSQVAAAVSPLGSSKRMGAAAGVRDCVLASAFLGAGSGKLLRARSLETHRGRGRRSRQQALRRPFSASLEHFAAHSGDEEEFLQGLEGLALELQQERADGSEDSVAHSESWRSEEGDASGSFSCFGSEFSPVISPVPFSSTELLWLPVLPETPDWPDQIVPHSVARSANSVELPLSLRIIKRKKRREDGWFRETGESACCSVKRAFSSMVFMIRELQSYTLQMREVLCREDLQGILARVKREMNSSFVWLFQQIFSCTPTLMVSIMLLLANFTVYSMGHLDASAMSAPDPPTQQSLVETVVVEERRQSHHNQSSIVKTFSSTGRTISIGGSGAGGGGKARPVAGATGDGRPDGGSSAYSTILPDGISTASGAVNAEEGEQSATEDGALVAVAAARAEEEARVWKGIREEVASIQSSTRDEALMDPETVRRLVSPVAVELEPDDYSDYLRTEIMYQHALSQDPENALLLANFAQFLHVVHHDHDRAEYYFKRATGLKPADAEALGRYASFLWLARKDLEAAEETYLEAIAADPGNTVHAANYAHFLWSTGGEDTCYPLDDGNNDAW
ncbi:hypothetical protein C4D60_Mb09t03430 [Musa balbisiana]|uniref:Uncharacterized protein n=1 Tax=Musa balbisiana TaxID=52838 RepID=A0A4V6T404_MUSBA|nr:hypothetical protein C4D60_Mb09t03430 [Musa balbisiana]